MTSNTLASSPVTVRRRVGDRDVYDVHHAAPTNPIARRNALVEGNRCLVFFVLNRYFARLTGPDRDDAESAGYLGLVAAADAYDPALGKFSTYAVRAIWGAIWKQQRQARGQGFAGVSRDGVPAGTCLSMETPIGNDPTSGTVADRVADPSVDIEGAVTERGDQVDQLAVVWHAVNYWLQPRQADILRLHYQGGLSIEEIAARRGEKVRNIQTGHHNALKRLRAIVDQQAEAAAGAAKAKATRN